MRKIIELLKEGTTNLENRVNLEHTLLTLNDFGYLQSTLLENDNFVIRYNEKTNTFNLETSFSNRAITNEFINEMNLLVKLVDEMNSLNK